MKNIKIKMKKAFSLAEVMIALVIVAILMAASAPLVNRRASLDNSFSCFWHTMSNGIYFNDKGTGQIAIGTKTTPEGYGAVPLLIATSRFAPQIAFLDSEGGTFKCNNLIGLFNNNIQIGGAYDFNKTSNNIVIGHASDDYPADGNKLVIASRNTTNIPILYGQFGTGNSLTDQKLKVNGKLQVGEFNGLDLSTTGYSLLVDENGIIVKNSDSTSPCTKINANSISVNTDSSKFIELTPSLLKIDNGSKITEIGQSIKAGTYIESGTYVKANSYIEATGEIKSTGGNISAAGNITAGGTITGATIDSTGNITAGGTITGANITSNGEIEALGLGEQLSTIIKNMITTQMSDERLKKDIINAPFGLDAIRKIEVKEYKFIDEKKYGEGIRYGVIAQEIQKILPNTVKENKDGFLTIHANDIFFIAINAIKELDKEIQNIKQMLEFDDFKIDCSKLSSLKIIAQVNKLKDENKELKNEINVLKENNQNLEKRLENLEKKLQKEF